MNRTIMICLSVLLVLGLTACTQAVSKAAAEQSAVPSAADSTEQNVLPESTEPPAPEMIDFEVNRYAVTAGAAAYLGGAEEQYKALVDAVCSKKETEPYTDEDAAKRAAEVFAETPYSAFADVTAQNGAFQITYNETGDADTFDAAVKALVESCVYKDANETEKALSLYRTVASEFAQEGSYAVQQDTLSTDTKFDAVFADVKDFTVDVYGHFVYLSTESSEDGYQNSIGTESFTAAVG